ncbi:hypothetical protein [Actinoplanes sp. RD1]|uniref:hypothetical protein n=1 Tax=Actinoplanes sp. RD1 TaxID=3064538 RepID=UPI00274045A1|nr:hypothetical protein [Actinoplanes sp. RD1]
MRSSGTIPVVGRHTIGNALVVHARDRISSEAQALALAVAADGENDIVVLDLHDGLPMGSWEALAGAVPRGRRGIRLLVCGAGLDIATLAGQWLSDRLGRSVVVPYGHLLRGASGALFVHAQHDSGWVRHRPGRGPAWDGKRWPRPAWDSAAAEYLPTSAFGVAEPLPGGVWLRDTRDDAAVAEHWQWLASAVPCQPRAFTIVLGCPGTTPLPLDDVARFWRDLGDDGRQHARFVHYGPVRVPEGETVGQALADVLESPVVCFTGVPVGRPDRPRMHTVAPDGRLGWQVYARELAYQPRSRPTVRAEVPRILSYRAPMVLGEMVAPMVYRYADDAVVEIVQSGLWVRPPEPPRHAERIRARAADPAGHAVVVDDAEPALVPRLRELADDLVARLDDATKERSTLQLASAVAVAGNRAPQPAGGELPDGLTYRFTAADLMLDALIEEVPAAAELAGVAVPVEAAVVAPPAELAGVAAPAEAAGVVGPAVLGFSRPGVAGGDLLRQPAEPPARSRSFVPPPPVASAPPAAPVVSAPFVSAPPAEPRAWVAPEVVSAPPAEPPAWVAPEAELPSRVDSPVLIHTPARVETALTEEDAARVLESLRRAEDVRAGLVFARVPAPAAQGVPGPEGLAAEREWLRGALSREFDAAASSVSRILAEHPGFHAGPDTMTDAVAVRLYLSPVGDGLDEALRTGNRGPQVPFARCVTAGLSRLPSHRGLALLRADLSGADLRAVEAQRVLTEWGFTNALTEPADGLTGSVDVLVWSMTGRRTRLLELEDGTGVPARVLFRPGTSFKVLETSPPLGERRGRLLLRELPPDEPDRGHVPFDDLALSSLHRAAEQWAVAGPPATSLPAAAVPRFARVPGVA